jgi:hypothetical protein
MPKKGPKFLGIDDFGTIRAALSHVPIGTATQIRGILERGERSLILTHRTTLTDGFYANCKHTTQLKHYAHDFQTRETKALIGKANKLICQLESVHYLHGPTPYIYVIISESHVPFMKTDSKTFKGSGEVKLM